MLLPAMSMVWLARAITIHLIVSKVLKLTKTKIFKKNCNNERIISLKDNFYNFIAITIRSSLLWMVNTLTLHFYVFF